MSYLPFFTFPVISTVQYNSQKVCLQKLKEILFLLNSDELGNLVAKFLNICYTSSYTKPHGML